MATASFEAQIGETTLTENTASVYAAYVDVSGDPIPSSYQTLHVRYALDPEGTGMIEKTFQATLAIGSILQWRDFFLTGLQPGTTYYWVAYIGIPTVTTSDSGSFRTPGGGGAFIYDDGDFQPAMPYIYDGGWQEATPNIYDGGWNG